MCSTSHMTPHIYWFPCTRTGSRHGLWSSLVLYLGETIGVQPASTRRLALDFTSCYRFVPYHRENSPITQTTPEPTLSSWGGWPHEKFLPHPWPHGKPGLIALIGPLRPYCSQSPLILLRCHGNKICSKPALTWKLTSVLAFPAHCISS